MPKVLENYKKYIDDDIISFFNEELPDEKGELHPRWWYTASPELVMTNLQLISVINEAFARGFIIK